MDGQPIGTSSSAAPAPAPAPVANSSASNSSASNAAKVKSGDDKELIYYYRDLVQETLHSL